MHRYFVNLKHWVKINYMGNMPVNKSQLIVATRTIKRMRVDCPISNNQFMHCNFYYYRKKTQIMKIEYYVIVIGIFCTIYEF